MKYIWSTVLFLTIISCGKSETEKIIAAKDHARQLLSSNLCGEAIRVLDEAGFQHQDSDYLQLYSSAQACDGLFSEIELFANDISKLDVSPVTDFMGSMTTFDTSNDIATTSTADSAFTKLQGAINTLLYPGTLTDSSHANRLTQFSAAEVNNMGVQTLYMILANLGRWLHFYGNPDGNGVKGTGSGADANTCIMTYTNVVARDATDDGSSGSCVDPSTPADGHVSIDNGGIHKAARQCEGIILFNNMVNLILNIDFTGGNVGSLTELSDAVDTLCSDIVQIPGVMCEVRDLDDCIAETAANREIYIAWLFERNFL